MTGRRQTIQISTRDHLRLNRRPLYVAVSLCTAILILSYHFLGVLYLVAPRLLFGKNAYITLPALFFGLSSFVLFLMSNKQTLLSWRAFSGVIFLGWWGICVGIARQLVYGEDLTLLYSRYLVMLFTFSLVAANLLRDRSTRDRFAGLLVIATLVQGFLGIVHAHWFSNINVVQDSAQPYLAFDLDPTREAGTLVSSNAYGSTLLCGLFLLAFYDYRTRPFRLVWVKSAIFIFLLYAISLSGSRYPIAVGVALGGCFVYGSFKASTTQFLYALALSMAIAITLAVVNPHFESKAVMRFDEDSGGRLDKLVLPLQLLASDIRAPLIGASAVATEQARSTSDIGISDNSYLLMALQFGLPVLAAWALVLAEFFKGWVRQPIGLAMFCYFLLNLGLTNSILWEPWLFYFVLTFYCIVLDKRVARGSNVGNGSLRL